MELLDAISNWLERGRGGSIGCLFGFLLKADIGIRGMRAFPMYYVIFLNIQFYLRVIRYRELNYHDVLDEGEVLYTGRHPPFLFIYDNFSIPVIYWNRKNQGMIPKRKGMTYLCHLRFHFFKMDRTIDLAVQWAKGRHLQRNPADLAFETSPINSNQYYLSWFHLHWCYIWLFIR